jgi:hypothetical protein
MTTFTEVLPVRKSSKSSAIKFTKATDNDFSPVAGFLTIDTDNSRGEFRVEEFPTGDSARGFILHKLTPGTDKATEFYSIRCRAELPSITGCDCKGFTRFFHCKHADAVNACVANGWL